MIIGQAEWNAEAQRCPGIDSEKAESVTKDAIVKSLLVGMVHDRGMGEDWTHDEALALLTEADAREGGHILREFEDDFFSTHTSKVVHETDQIRVVDTTTPALDELGSSKTFRRLEFTNSATVTQSEVALDLWGRPDHTRLALDVHRIIAGVVRTRLKAGPGLKRMVLIGGGAGCLSSHVTSDASLSSALRVDVVEPNMEVSKAAMKYFGAKYAVPNGNINLHEMTGDAFLESKYASESSVDALVVDAAARLPLSFFTGRESDSVQEPIAPTPSLLRNSGALVKCLKEDGVTIINFLGDKDLLEAMYGIITSALSAEGIAMAHPVILAPSYIPNRIILLSRKTKELQRLVRALQVEDEHIRAYLLHGARGNESQPVEVPFEV